MKKRILGAFRTLPGISPSLASWSCSQCLKNPIPPFGGWGESVRSTPLCLGIGHGQPHYRTEYPKTLGKVVQPKNGLKGKKAGEHFCPPVRLLACVMYRLLALTSCIPALLVSFLNGTVKLQQFFGIPNKSFSFVYVPAIQSHFSSWLCAGRGDPLTPSKNFCFTKLFCPWHTD